MIELSDYQQHALKTLEKNKAIYLAWGLGAGKTFFSCYFIIDKWRQTGVCNKTLIVCPINVFHSFEESLNKLGIDQFRYFEIIDTPKKKQEFINGKIVKPIVIMNYDFYKNNNCVSGGRGWLNKPVPITGAIPNFKPEILIMDESHEFKNPKSIIGKKVAMNIKMPTIKYKIFGSGTPISIDIRDLFNQFLALDGGKTFGQNFYTFESNFMYDANAKNRRSAKYFPLKREREGAKEKAFSMLGDIVSFVETEKVVKLPKLSIFDIQVGLYPEQAKIYEDVRIKARMEFLSEEEKLINKEITKTQFYQSALSKLSVLRQVCCGFVYERNEENPNERRVMRVPTKKLDALRKGLSKIPYNEKFIIWTVFVETFPIISELLEELGIKHVSVNGRVSSKQKKQNIKDFTKVPSIRCLVGHPRSGGSGLNLQIAKYSFNYCMDFSFINKKQSEGRNYRRGSSDLHDQISRFNLVTKGTVEESINLNLDKKEKVVSEFRKHLTGEGHV